MARVLVPPVTREQAAAFVADVLKTWMPDTPVLLDGASVLVIQKGGGHLVIVFTDAELVSR